MWSPDGEELSGVVGGGGEDEGRRTGSAGDPDLGDGGGTAKGLLVGTDEGGTGGRGGTGDGPDRNESRPSEVGEVGLYILGGGGRVRPGGPEGRKFVEAVVVLTQNLGLIGVQ